MKVSPSKIDQIATLTVLATMNSTSVPSSLRPETTDTTQVPSTNTDTSISTTTQRTSEISVTWTTLTSTTSAPPSNPYNPDSCKEEESYSPNGTCINKADAQVYWINYRK